MFAQRSVALMLALTLAQGCFYDEGIQIVDMRGKVVLPASAATRIIPQPDGTNLEVEDVRFIGPVYVGLYPGVASDIAEYPRPVFGPNNASYPYGGTSIGDIRYSCLPQLTCRHTSGRFEGWDDIVDWFEFAYDEPLTTADLQQENPAGTSNVPLEDGEQLRERCYDYLRITEDEEARIVATDRNADGEVNELDLDFVKNEETGNWEAEFTLWQQEVFPDAVLWGWMDAPDSHGLLSTCNPLGGFTDSIYDNAFYGGEQFSWILNVPADPTVYMGQGQQDNLNRWNVRPGLSFWQAVEQQPGVPIQGDWVASEGQVWSNPYDAVELAIDFRVE